MALTSAQIVDVRRFAGYPALGTLSGIVRPVYLADSATQDMQTRLATLSADEETILTGTYLTNLTALETAVLTAQTNLDTDTAGPWKANRREIAQRTSLFNKWRLDMCAFLGFNPGPALAGGTSGMQIVRA